MTCPDCLNDALITSAAGIRVCAVCGYTWKPKKAKRPDRNEELPVEKPAVKDWADRYA